MPTQGGIMLRTWRPNEGVIGQKIDNTLRRCSQVGTGACTDVTALHSAAMCSDQASSGPNPVN